MLFRDKLGWPIERIKGRWFYNFLRLLIHVNIKVTFKRRNVKMKSYKENGNIKRGFE